MDTAGGEAAGGMRSEQPETPPLPCVELDSQWTPAARHTELQPCALGRPRGRDGAAGGEEVTCANLWLTHVDA